jgi:hypothetical protein
MSTPEPVPTPKTTPVKAPTALTDIQVSGTVIKEVFKVSGNVALALKGKVPVRLGKYSLMAVYDYLNAQAEHPDRKTLFARVEALQAATDKENESKRRKIKINKGRRAASAVNESSKSSEAIQVLITDLSYWANKLNEATRKISEIKSQLQQATAKPTKK